MLRPDRGSDCNVSYLAKKKKNTRSYFYLVTFLHKGRGRIIKQSLNSSKINVVEVTAEAGERDELQFITRNAVGSS